MSVEELELVVSRLAADELALFSQWFDEFRVNSGIVKLKPMLLRVNSMALAAAQMTTSSPDAVLPFETFCLTRILIH